MFRPNCGTIARFGGAIWTSRQPGGMNESALSRCTRLCRARPAKLASALAVPMKTFFLKFFTWWNGQTFGTQLWTWRFGEVVGEDEGGNRYYRTIGGKIDPSLGFERRWVIYNGLAEPSRVPPSWHGWLHHTVDVPPTQENYKPRPWQKPHRANLTGTPGAHRPTGSTLAQGRRPKATGDYKPWAPGR
jgi:NADH:ubiquinone oxidoreductase subunit